jgi:hypothetical protein
MNALLIPYPEIDPVLVQLGPFAIRWYALAYIAGLVIGGGEGRRNDPFRYWLPEREAEWRSDPVWLLEQQNRETINRLEQLTGACLPTWR